MNTAKRLACGQKAGIGTLYDARQDRFLPVSLFRDGVVATDAVSSSPLSNKRETTVVVGNTAKAKLEGLGVQKDLGTSLMANMIPESSISGSAEYLTNKHHQEMPVVHRALVHTVSTRQDQLDFMFPEVKTSFDFAALATTEATHLVLGVTWGSRIIISAEAILDETVDKSKLERQLNESFRNLSSIASSKTHTGDAYPVVYSTPLDVKVFSDQGNVDTFATLDGATQALKHFEKGIEASGDGHGQPIMYTLLPVGFLVTLGAMIGDDAVANQLPIEHYELSVDFFDSIASTTRALTAYYKQVKKHRTLVSATHLSDVADALQSSRSADRDFRTSFRQAIQEIRSGRATGQAVAQLIERHMSLDSAPQRLLPLTQQYEKKLPFLTGATSLGAEFVGGRAGLDEAFALGSFRNSTVNVFFFGDEVIGRDTSWEDNVALLQEILNKGPPRPVVLLVDTDLDGTTSTPLSQAFTSVYFGGAVVVKDLLQQRRELADKSLMKYDRQYLEPVTDVPSHRQSVRLPCPGPGCGKDECEWICYKCLERIEFGTRDGYFYCDCGRYPFDRVGFDCQRPSHAVGSTTVYRRHVLEKLLRSLPPPREVNILILGETGVGKSTFVNAFINYLTFSSLDEGLSASKLNWIIPCSFTTQVIDEKGRLVSKDVIIGHDADEQDGSKGQSATQQATVYPLYFRDTLIRLIDTPGIGDTRGLDQDGKNMTNVLSVLRNYQDLHGILILLKPNNARLGVMFRFCVKELLTHLHRSAAQNMVFGFTNTRGSNYTPGDTFKPLEKLLSDYRDVIPGLFRDNVYCFDSESFRYLAAKKQDVDMGNVDDYRRSWLQSAAEAERLLGHFKSLRPHNTQRTLSLNETRHLIAQLTAPMQQISTAITDTISKSETQEQELRDTKLTGEALKKKLRITKTSVTANQLKRPKTVCAHSSCVEPVFDEKSNAQVLLRKNLCHNPCCLINVPVGKVGTPELVSCAAFQGDSCRLCGHHWKEHEHILVEYKASSTTVTDESIQRDLKKTGDEVQAKQTTIKGLQKLKVELKEEHRQIQEAAARFSVYLKSNSITHYNDATVEYLEHLIKDEKTKARVGASRQRLEALEKDLDTYRKFVSAMEQGKKSQSPSTKPLDEQGVAELVGKLYALPHYGQMLRDLARVVGRAYEANFRERPYRIRGQRYWTGQTDMGAWERKGHPRGNGHPDVTAITTRYRSMVDEVMMDSGNGFDVGSGPSFFDAISATAGQGISRLRQTFGSSVASGSGSSRGVQPPHSYSTPILGRRASGAPEMSMPVSWAWENHDQQLPSSSRAPLRSISDWGQNSGGGGGQSGMRDRNLLSEKSRGKLRADGNDDDEGSSTRPPPYSETDTNGYSGEGSPEVRIVQKKGIWLRLKDKMRKY